MITDSSTDKEKGDLKQAVTSNMYFALSDQEKEARVSYCHFLIINVKKKKQKKNLLLEMQAWKCTYMEEIRGEKVTNLAHKQCPGFLQENED